MDRHSARRRRLVAASICALIASHTSTARADDSVPIAQSLFEQGRLLMSEGRYAEACPKLAESQRLDPGGGTLLNLAACHAKLGRTASAWAEYKQALGAARVDGRQDRIDEANARIAELEPILSGLRISVDRRNPPDIRVESNGVEVRATAWGTKVPVDPGSFTITAIAPGRLPFRTLVEVKPNAHVAEVAVPMLALEAPQAPESPERSTGAPTPEPRAPPGPPVVGWASLGIGVVGLGVGTYFGLRALEKKRQSDEICDQTVCPKDKSRAVELHDEAETSAWISDLGFGVGIVGVGVGVLLLLTHDASAGSPGPVGVAIEHGGASIWMGKRW